MDTQAFSIEPLSKATVQKAGAMANKVFEGDFPPPSLAFQLSLKPLLKRLYALMGRIKLTPGERDFEYWVAKERETGKVVGTTGLYNMIGDPLARWLGWMSVDPEYRGLGIGKALLQHSIDKAKESGAQVLRLYTSDRPNEATAQLMYESHGFQEVNRVWNQRQKFHTIYRELILQKIEEADK